MVRKIILSLALALGLSTQSLASLADPGDIGRFEGVAADAHLSDQTSSTLKPSIVTGTTSATINVELLGKAIADRQKEQQEIERKEKHLEFVRKHPKFDWIARKTGYYWVDREILMPVSDWGVDHQGLSTLAGGVASLASMGLIAGGAAR